MRALFLALMIALLPLRGWVGDVMAMDMLAQALQQPESAIKSVAAHADGMRLKHGFDTQPIDMGMADCHGHAAPAADAAHPNGSTPASHGGDCTTHAACQLCHSAALTPMSLLLGAGAMPGATPPSVRPHFASAERAPGFKPPIA